ncbi:hypothetical protein N0V94_008223, partial [Neodidymelliopsis sp. IMI 364377]
GETKKLATLAESAANRYPSGNITTPVIMQGPYGNSIINEEASNVLAISGGTGITYTLPIVMAALADTSGVRNIELVWTVRHLENLAWVGPELAYLNSQLNPMVTRTYSKGDELDKTPITFVELAKHFRIRIFVTRRDDSSLSQQGQGLKQPSGEKEKGYDYGYGLSPVSSTSSVHSTSSRHQLEELVSEQANFSITYLDNTRPIVSSLVDAFMDDTVEKGRTQVVGSGPPQLGSQIRSAVAAKNMPGNAWLGDDRGDVQCVWDDRMG